MKVWKSSSYGLLIASVVFTHVWADDDNQAADNKIEAGVTVNLSVGYVNNEYNASVIQERLAESLSGEDHHW